MTGSDRAFVAGCFVATTIVLGVIQISEGEAMRSAIEKASPAEFPSSMDVVVKNENPIPVEVHQPQSANMHPDSMSNTEPLEVKIINRGMSEAVPINSLP